MERQRHVAVDEVSTPDELEVDVVDLDDDGNVCAHGISYDERCDECEDEGLDDPDDEDEDDDLDELEDDEDYDEELES